MSSEGVGIELKAAVVGAGIGGLTAAIALRQAGAEVAVFERATELKEVGAGLLLAANAQKALGKLGLSEKVGRLGTSASAGELDWQADPLPPPTERSAREVRCKAAHLP